MKWKEGYTIWNIIKDLPPIERKPDDSLPPLTPGQRNQVRKLVKACCNHDNGNCLLLDDGEEHPCPQRISHSVCCTWFRWCVLPQDKVLEMEIVKPQDTKHCVICSSVFCPGSNRAKYCETCAKAVRRRQKADNERKRRNGVDN